MKTTKRPKSVIVRYEKETIINMISEYDCPVCQYEFVGTVGLYVTRFICDCGQELIVQKEK